MKQLPKSFEAKSVESTWQKFWEEGRFFRADPTSKKPPFCVVIPPPNVTGALHMGHALGNTLEDIIVRWKRMSGYETLWVPGTDHAGISTQTVVERHLMQTEGKRRSDCSREEFLEKAWQWKEAKEQRIIDQLKSLGCSCDWSRLRFTMDEGNNRAVRVTFKRLFDAGLIYRGNRLINWDPVTKTALADDEVEYEERSGFMWYFKYPLKERGEFLQIATTRPETMLGDTAVAVNPYDARYESLIGKTVVLPLMDREIPIIADDHVDPEFGTGMVKITPAHDPNDYEIGLRHDVAFINIMTPDGRINSKGGKFAGLTMQEAREAVVSEMDKLGLLEKVEPHCLRVGISYRSKATIEPYLSRQWFVKMDDFRPLLREAVQEERVSLVPPNWKNTYYHWIDNLRDWCISRQLWWGHRIPIWYKKGNPEELICYDGEGTPEEVASNPALWEQDPDVLDTWFSSALFPFAALGWPDHTPELQKFYPNSTMITGHDILFFWVARMIMMGEYIMHKPPFPEVYLHSLIFGKSYWRNNKEGGITYIEGKERIEYDLGKKPVPSDVISKWEKMSKSKGNIIDPLEIIDEYGTDAMRMALCSSASHTWQIDLDRRRFEEFKNFANKLWNGARFVIMNLSETAPLTPEEFAEGLDEKQLQLEDLWILSQMNRSIHKVVADLEGYKFDQAAQDAYDFYWKEFCSYYVEIAKPFLFGKAGSPAHRKNKQKLLLIILCQAIRLIHPMAPFITEELFQVLKERFEWQGAQQPPSDPYTRQVLEALSAPSCAVSSYPSVARDADIDESVEESFCFISKVVYLIRNIRGEMKIPPGTHTEVAIHSTSDPASLSLIQENLPIIEALVKGCSLTCYSHEPSFDLASTGSIHNVKVTIPMPKDLARHEASRLEKEQAKLNALLEKIESQLSNMQFVAKAPEELLAKQRILLEKTRAELKAIDEQLASLRKHDV